jgi:hypothetical protein
MPDITATRPADAAPVATDWGQQVHDMLEGIQVGTAAVVLSGTSTGTTAVTFPRAYASAPRVFLSMQVTNSNAASHAWVSSGGPVTTTGFTCAAGRDDATTGSTTLQVAWMAIGTLA